MCPECLDWALATTRFIEKCNNSTKLLNNIFENLAEILNIEIEPTKKEQCLYVIVGEKESKVILLDNQQKKKKRKDRKFECHECKEQFEKKEELRAHNLGLHTKFTCEECLQTFDSEQDLELHLSSNHEYRCLNCNKYMNSEECLKEHKDKLHTVYMCKDCGKSFKGLDRLQAHEEKHVLKNECPKCKKTYLTKECYAKHVQLCLEDHIDPHPFRGKIEKSHFCEKCGKGYSTSGGLRVHDRFVHGNAKPHECEICGKQFTAPSYLKIHMIKHTGQKNFRCNICGNKFVSKEALLYHTRRHTGEKPYSCKLCTETFVNASARAEHIKFKHSGPTLKCNICKKKFFTASFLKQHIKRHQDPSSKLFIERSMIPPNMPGDLNMRIKTENEWTVNEES